MWEMKSPTGEEEEEEEEEQRFQELRKTFVRDGFVRIPRSILCLNDLTEIETMRDAFEELFQGRFATGIYPDEIHWRQGISKENACREICNGWKACPRVARVVCSPSVGRLACQLMGWQSCRIGQDDVLHKTPLSGPVGFHQDGAYISDHFSPPDNNSLTIWMALDDADAETGALQYAPGSHHWRHTGDTGSKEEEEVGNEDTPSFHLEDGQDHMASLARAAQKAHQNVQDVLASVQTVSAKTGDIIVHHQDVWHGSGPNTSPSRHRRALVAHLLDGSVQWRNDKPPQYIYGRYFIRGEDSPREDFFPTTYTRATTTTT